MSYVIDHVKGYVNVTAFDFLGTELGHDARQSFNELKMSDIGHIGLNSLYQERPHWELIIRPKSPIGNIWHYYLDYGTMTAENFEIRQADVDSIMLYFQNQLKGGNHG